MKKERIGLKKSIKAVGTLILTAVILVLSPQIVNAAGESPAYDGSVQSEVLISQ